MSVNSVGSCSCNSAASMWPARGEANGVVRKLGTGHFKPEVEAKLAARFAHRMPDAPAPTPDPVPDPAPGPDPSAPPDPSDRLPDAAPAPAPDLASDLDAEPAPSPQPLPGPSGDLNSRPLIDSVTLSDASIAFNDADAGLATVKPSEPEQSSLLTQMTRADLFKTHFARVDVLA